jgi:hypothetical protein
MPTVIISNYVFIIYQQYCNINLHLCIKPQNNLILGILRKCVTLSWGWITSRIPLDLQYEGTIQYFKENHKQYHCFYWSHA